MANIKIETKNQLDIGRKPRVYFTCHPDDFDRYFVKIREDIFVTHDCKDNRICPKGQLLTVVKCW
jgi:hypothetical protein